MYEQVKVSGRLLGSQSSSDCLLFANLQTPIGTLPAAALRFHFTFIETPNKNSDRLILYQSNSMSKDNILK